ncbi:hypothetical protein PIB30_048852 [Stylosanthes scabra]|uniref:Uncharacterized protein n=1 Tax=Stylosanthes scabra TaxID=79078 RepID=A0ABU6VG18_9FABA|nr:hypothetical protein [Stylosanthes scabra]
MPSTQHVRSSSSTERTSSSHRKTASKLLRKTRNWELIQLPEGWICDGDDEKEIGGMEPSVQKEESSEEDPEEEEDPKEEEDHEEEIPASSSLPMDIDADEDYLRFIEELEHRPEHCPLRISQASVQASPEEASDRQSNGHNASSYDLSRVWQAPSSGPSS